MRVLPIELGEDAGEVTAILAVELCGERVMCSCGRSAEQDARAQHRRDETLRRSHDASPSITKRLEYLLRRFTRVLSREPCRKFDDCSRARYVLELFGRLCACGAKLRADHHDLWAGRLQQDQRVRYVGGGERAVSRLFEQLAKIRQDVRRLVHAQHIRVVERVDASLFC